MMIKMKSLDHPTLVTLNESSIRAQRRQNIPPGKIPADNNRQYIVNFRFDHEGPGGGDIRLSVILKPGVLTAWLDVSPQEYDAIPEVELTELEWEAAVCVGIPRWVQ